MKKSFVATIGLVACLAFTATAAAEVRTGDATDPTADSIGPPGGDLVSAHASYDTNGSLTVSATTAGPPSGLFSFQVASTSGLSCLGDTATLWGIVPGSTSVLTLAGTTTPTSTAPVVSGNTVTFSTSGPALQNQGWSCMTVSVSDPSGGNSFWDQLTAPAYFGGHAPDTDKDGVPDSTDKCPTKAGPAGNGGCPPAPVTHKKAKPVKVPASCKKLHGHKRTLCIKQSAKKKH